jgi:hypothetical protein
MRVIFTVVVAFLTGAAHANTSSIMATEAVGGGGGDTAALPPPTRLALGHVRGGAVDRMHVAVVNTQDGPHVRWTLQVSTRSQTPREIIVALGVSRDVAIQGFHLSITGQPSFAAVAVSRSHARVSYEAMTRHIDDAGLPEDPGLLEIVATDGATDTLQLRVSPVSRDAPGTVVIDLAIPGGNQLIVDPGPRAITVELEDSTDRATWNRAAKPRAWPVRTTRMDGPGPAAILTRATSLVAGPWIAPDPSEPRFYGRYQVVPPVELSARVDLSRPRDQHPAD